MKLSIAAVAVISVAAVAVVNDVCCKNLCSNIFDLLHFRRDVPVGVPLDLSTPTGMSCIGTYGENCKSDNMSKYRVLLVAFLLIWHED